jgi:hypothetical protein
VRLKADVASFGSSGATDLSRHTFKITTTPDVFNDSVNETIVAFGKISNSQVSTTLSSPTAHTQTVQRTKLYLTTQALGGSSGRVKSSADDLGIINLTADNAGTAKLDFIRVTFSGSAVTSSLQSNVKLLDQNGYDVVVSFPGVAKVITQPCSSGTCTIDWYFEEGDVSILGGSAMSFKVRIDSAAGTKTASAGQSVGLTASINANLDVRYTTGISGGTPGATLPTIAVPASINSVTYASGT